MDFKTKTKWTLWEHRSKGPDDERWMDQFYPVATVDTLENLWLLWGHYPKPSLLFAGSKPNEPPPLLKRGERTSRVLGLCFFKEAVPPETKATNAKGETLTGMRSIVDIDTSFDDLKAYDSVWETLLLTLVGEEVLLSADLNGAWLANRTRKGFLSTSVRLRLELWWAAHVDGVQAETLKDELVKAISHNNVLGGWRIR